MRGRVIDYPLWSAGTGPPRPPKGSTTPLPPGAAALAAAAEDGAWWRHGVLYEIYPRSFADADGDGTGDLKGVIARLDHLAWLGVDAIWLTPTFPSPNADWGYDVADYRGVHPDLGSLADLDALVEQAGRRGIRVLLDLVPNHTSDQHPWFQDAMRGRGARYRDFYVWADPRPDGSPPNNWRSLFAGSAWAWHEPTGQYYLRNFLPSQPDLNWWNEEVRAAFDDVLRFWFERGIAGFRIDVAHGIVHDRELRDDPVATAEDHPLVRAHGLRQVYSMHRPEVHDVLRRWRALAARERPERILIGETAVLDVERLMRFYGPGEDQLHLAFNFSFLHGPFAADAARANVEHVEASLPPGAWPVYTGSTHDAGRLASRWAEGDERRVRCALLMLLALRGTPLLYQGDEIGLRDVHVDAVHARDPVGWLSEDRDTSRDRCRTPMPWSARAGGDFSADPAATPWLPLGDIGATNVAGQREDPGSTLHFVRDLIALRRRRADLHAGSYRTVAAGPAVWTWQRGEGHVVALNLGEERAELPGLAGRVAIGTERGRDGEALAGALFLAPYEGVVVELAGPA